MPVRGLGSLDRSVGALGALVAIDVSGNNLATLPDALSQIGGLQRLDASRNQIAALPGCVWSCAKLRHLSLAHNAIGPALSELPPAAACAGTHAHCSVCGKRGARHDGSHL